MINEFQASKIAFDYFKSHLNVTGLAEAMESSDGFIFVGGKNNSVNVGGVTIFVSKNNGDVKVLTFPSKENTRLIRESKELSVDSCFFSK